MFDIKEMSQDDINTLYSTIKEDHFNDYKAKDISGKGFCKIVSAFANASGGDIYIGIREDNVTKIKHWEGFSDIEDANAFIQQLESFSQVDDFYAVEFLQHPTNKTLVMKVNIFKTQKIVTCPNGKVYVRKGAQSLPIDTEEKKRRLELDKGLSSYEDEYIAESIVEDIIDSDAMSFFSNQIIPNSNPLMWAIRQRLIRDSKVSVAGELLFADEPQICLPKRSSIKIMQYRTVDEGDRDTLAADPITIEGCAYKQIYDAVDKVKSTIEGMKKIGNMLSNVSYPEETLHEIITNAVLHRDYSIATDIQIRIFDNRVEVESPGKLPGHVTVNNILETQFSRNPKLVRLINKFPKAPNKDVGEGLNTAFNAMTKLRLKQPIIEEKSNSVLVIIKHERLASPDEVVLDYLKSHQEIVNRDARALTGIKSENTMKRVFWRLRDQGYIEMIPGRARSKSAWRLTNNETIRENDLKQYD